MKENDLHARLNRFKAQIVPSVKKEKKSKSFDSLGERLAKATGGCYLTNDFGGYCLIKTLYEWGTPFGSELLNQPNTNHRFIHEHYSAQAIDGGSSPSELIFFDLETTGLGGAGALAFLAGVGSITKKGFEVRQYLLPDYPDERAMLDQLAQEFGDERTVVSYNGAAFDMTLIRERLIINRVDHEINYKHHIDLLHPVRRLFKRRIGECSLTSVERNILSYFRTDDIPGYLIPSVYFEWLSSGDLGQINEVLEHNRIDILAMFFVLEQVARVFETDTESPQHAEDMYSLSRVYGRRKENDKVLEILDNPLVASVDPEVLFYRSLALKRAGRWEEAVAVWNSITELESKRAFLANIELAKYHEHRSRDYKQALSCAQSALLKSSLSENEVARLMHRVSRLKSKLISK